MAAKVGGRWGVFVDCGGCEYRGARGGEQSVDLCRRLESGMDEDADGCRCRVWSASIDGCWIVMWDGRRWRRSDALWLREGEDVG